MSNTASKRSQPPESAKHNIAEFGTRWLQPSTVVITVHGELDAANACEFIDYVQRHIPHTNQLVLDLNGVEFFGTAAFSAVHAVSVHTAAAGVEWMLVPSRAVSRLLSICDPDSALPVCHSTAAALSRLQGDPSNLLQLVPKAR